MFDFTVDEDTTRAALTTAILETSRLNALVVTSPVPTAETFMMFLSRALGQRC